MYSTSSTNTERCSTRIETMTTPELIDFEGKFPTVADGVFVAPGASVIGEVELGIDSSVWYNAVIRGDVCPISIGARTNIQDLSVIHVTSGTHPTTIGDDVTVGHGATIHGCEIEDRCLIGMGAIILDGAVVESESLVAAGSLIPPGMRIPSGSLVMGSPAKIKRELTDEERASIEASAYHYVELAGRHDRGEDG